jgi:hypothetical protein
MMDAHYWLFPWLSLVVSLAVAIGGLLLGRRSIDSNIRSPKISTGLIVVWIAFVVFMIAAGLKLGNWATIDYIPARGILGGAVGGIILTLTCRWNTTSSAARTTTLFALATAMVSASRLWLTHGEVSGLSATAFSLGVTLLCFVAVTNVNQGASAASAIRKSVVIFAYFAALAFTVLIGFSRAETLGDVFWADIPLMFGSAICVGLLIAASVERFGTWAKSVAVSAVTLAVICPLGVSIAHSLPVIGLTVLGAACIGLPTLLIGRTVRKDLSIYLGYILLVAGITVAFTLLSGYGLGIFVLGGMTAAAIAESADIPLPVSWLTFAAVLLIYRMEILQNGNSVDAIGPGDMWDLLAITLGVLVPRTIASWVFDYTPKLTWSTALQWLVAISIPTLLLDYVWQPRSLTGLFLGLAVGQLAGVRLEKEGQQESAAITTLLVGVLLFLFLPGLEVLNAPTRTVRLVCVIALALLVALKITVQRRSIDITTKAA